VLLVLTMAKQIHKQWRDRTSRGVSKWLYLGQCSAEIGFIVYSVMVRNWVFVFTNAALLLENVVGLAIVLHHRRTRPGAT
jgi:hypothetical protein